MKMIFTAVAVLGLASVASMAVAPAAPSFGAGRWEVYETGADAVVDPVSNWQVVANCGANCLTVTEEQRAGDSQVASQFVRHSDGTWTGSWRITNGECYGDNGEPIGATATWTSSFTVRPDLTVADHVVDEVGCDGGRGDYNVEYTLTKLGSSERLSP